MGILRVAAAACALVLIGTGPAQAQGVDPLHMKAARAVSALFQQQDAASLESFVKHWAPASWFETQDLDEVTDRLGELRNERSATRLICACGSQDQIGMVAAGASRNSRSRTSVR